MDKYAFLLELNSNLEMKITGNEIKGDLGNLFFTISFTPDVDLRVYTKAYLFGDLPMADHIKSAYEKTSAFEDYLLEGENIVLLVPHEDLSMDSAFNIAQDIIAFANALASYGYKSKNSQIGFSGGASTLKGEYYSDLIKEEEDGQAKKESYFKSARLGWGILGASIATVISLLLFVVSGMTNSWFFFIPAVCVVAVLPLLMYEIFAKERVCGIGIIVCFALTVFAMLMGDRLIWTMNLIDWIPGATFAQAFAEVPYLVKDEVITLGAYLRDFFLMFGAMAVVYLITVLNYFTMKLSIVEWFKKHTILFN